MDIPLPILPSSFKKQVSTKTVNLEAPISALHLDSPLKKAVIINGKNPFFKMLLNPKLALLFLGDRFNLFLGETNSPQNQTRVHKQIKPNLTSAKLLGVQDHSTPAEIEHGFIKQLTPSFLKKPAPQLTHHSDQGESTLDYPASGQAEKSVPQEKRQASSLTRKLRMALQNTLEESNNFIQQQAEQKLPEWLKPTQIIVYWETLQQSIWDKLPNSTQEILQKLAGFSINGFQTMALTLLQAREALASWIPGLNQKPKLAMLLYVLVAILLLIAFRAFWQYQNHLL